MVAIRRCLADYIQTLIGAIISNFTSCASMHDWFTPGQCSSRRDEIAQIASLYYAFAVDIVSDLMSKCACLILWTLLTHKVMILPLRLVWNLRVPFYERIGIIATFGVALLCVAAAIVRVVSVGSKAGTSTPSSSWLALWAVIEGAIGKHL